MRLLIAVDDHAREALATVMDVSLSVHLAVRDLNQIISARDDGRRSMCSVTELASSAILHWAQERGDEYLNGEGSALPTHCSSALRGP